MGSICPRSFLFVIIQGINLVYSPREPVAVALDLPAKSLDTQSVGTKQQLGPSHSCRLNRGAGWILVGFAAYICCIRSSVTLDRNCVFVTLWLSYLFTRRVNTQKGLGGGGLDLFKSIRNSLQCLTQGPKRSKWWIVARCSNPIYIRYLYLW